LNRRSNGCALDFATGRYIQVCNMNSQWQSLWSIIL